MLPKNKASQSELEFVSIVELVPEDHLLRKVERAIDFEFIRGKVKDLYCPDNGRPAIDPVAVHSLRSWLLPAKSKKIPESFSSPGFFATPTGFEPVLPA